ncbi:hypothetical protein RYX36_013504 [Vicia faba]
MSNKIKNLKNKYKIWARIFTGCIYHKKDSSSHDYINADQVFILYCIGTGKKVDLPFILFNHLFNHVFETREENRIKSTKNARKWISFGRLISDILIESGIIGYLKEAGMKEELTHSVGKIFNAKSLLKRKIISKIVAPAGQIPSDIPNRRIPVEEYPMFSDEEPLEVILEYILICKERGDLVHPYVFTRQDVLNAIRKRKELAGIQTELEKDILRQGPEEEEAPQTAAPIVKKKRKVMTAGQSSAAATAVSVEDVVAESPEKPLIMKRRRTAGHSSAAPAKAAEPSSTTPAAEVTADVAPPTTEAQAAEAPTAEGHQAAEKRKPAEAADDVPNVQEKKRKLTEDSEKGKASADGSGMNTTISLTSSKTLSDDIGGTRNDQTENTLDISSSETSSSSSSSSSSDNHSVESPTAVNQSSDNTATEQPNTTTVDNTISNPIVNTATDPSDKPLTKILEEFEQTEHRPLSKIFEEFNPIVNTTEETIARAMKFFESGESVDNLLDSLDLSSPSKSLPTAETQIEHETAETNSEQTTEPLNQTTEPPQNQTAETPDPNSVNNQTAETPSTQTAEPSFNSFLRTELNVEQFKILRDFRSPSKLAVPNPSAINEKFQCFKSDMNDWVDALDNQLDLSQDPEDVFKGWEAFKKEMEFRSNKMQKDCVKLMEQKKEARLKKIREEAEDLKRSKQVLHLEFGDWKPESNLKVICTKPEVEEESEEYFVDLDAAETSTARNEIEDLKKDNKVLHQRLDLHENKLSQVLSNQEASAGEMSEIKNLLMALVTKLN